MANTMSLSFTLNADDAASMLDFLAASTWSDIYYMYNDKAILPRFFAKDTIVFSPKDKPGSTIAGFMQIMESVIENKEKLSSLDSFAVKLIIDKELSKALQDLLPKKGRSKNFLKFTLETNNKKNKTLTVTNVNNKVVEIKLIDYSSRVLDLGDLPNTLLERMKVKNNLTLNVNVIQAILNTSKEISEVVKFETSQTRQTFTCDDGIKNLVSGEFRIRDASGITFIEPSHLYLATSSLLFAFEIALSEQVKFTLMSDFPIFMESENETKTLKLQVILSPKFTEENEEENANEGEEITSKKNDESSEHDEGITSNDSDIASDASEPENSPKMQNEPISTNEQAMKEVVGNPGVDAHDKELRTAKRRKKKVENAAKYQSKETTGEVLKEKYFPLPSLYEIADRRGYVNPETRMISMDKEYQWKTVSVAISDTVLRQILKSFTYSASPGERRLFTEEKLLPVIAVESLRALRKEHEEDEEQIYMEEAHYAFYELHYDGIPKVMNPFITSEGFTQKGLDALKQAVAKWVADQEIERDRIKDNGKKIIDVLESVVDTNTIGASVSFDLNAHIIPQGVFELAGIGPGTGKKRSFGAQREPTHWELGKSFITTGGKASGKLVKKMKLAEDEIKKYYRDDFIFYQDKINDILHVFHFSRDDLAPFIDKLKSDLSIPDYEDETEDQEEETNLPLAALIQANPDMPLYLVPR